MDFWRKVGDWLLSGELPDCPSCKGTGEAPVNQIDDIVYWKGRQVRVCYQCKGAGKI